MNTPFIVAQIIRACVLGISAAEREDRSPASYLDILNRLADDLENREQSVPVVPEFSRAGVAVEMPGTNGGFTMAVFEGRNVPVGTMVYVRREG